MPRNDIDTPRLVDGDRVRDDRGNTGYARASVNRKTQERFVGVFITDGPAKNTWGQPHRFTPELDHVGGSLLTVCIKCSRYFMATVRVERVGELLSKNVAREEKCRTCTGHRRTAAQRDRDQAVDTAGEHVRRTKHHAVPGRDL